MNYLIKHIDKILITAFCWVPFLYLMYSSTSGVPFNDDYDLFLHSICNLKTSNRLKDFPELLFFQHMEHRPAYPRMVGLLVWAIAGTCDLRILALIGNCMLFLTWLLINQTVAKHKLVHRFIFGITTFLIFASLQSMENLIWATGALQNYSFIFFSTCSIYCVLKKKNALSIICWILSIWCTITGFVLIPILFLLILKQSKPWLLIAFSVIVTITCALYFYKIFFPPVEKWPFIIPQKTLSAKLKYFLAFLGSFFTLGKSSVKLSIVGGSLLLLITLIINRKILSWDFWSYISVYIILVAITGVVFRSVLGPEQALSERYKIYSELLLIAAIYKIFIDNRKLRKYLGLFTCIIALQFILIWKFYTPIMTERKKNLDNGFYQFTVNKNFNFLTYPWQVDGASKLVRAYELGVYKGP